MKSVALALDHVAAVLDDAPLDELVVLLQQLHPGPVTHQAALYSVEPSISEEEHDDDAAVSGQPSQVRPFHLSPSGQILDRSCGPWRPALC